ncbi:hypothetical protein DTO013E5_10001 [Penicillium roqueforti]|uniref:Genomic scaffold, ProqFM164S02 n=1 Tax=Penicillium roqueforti (strain FM164) TaxID=1365484 RepID=W6QTS9_PENRF|nr:hypothetical protein CBS147355_9795 [Penicillium roqueforti]CDM32947.1 unnamed protein product [Penicillium roqueforti FM164]KAI2684325.1 hypothetical protein LCP963914a_5625 [Penicillium roqueforti]KAI2707836.1 hypothetical protein CBS147318_9748 [Penicillium roqueforti]KAI2734415.1 hypothetical protein DTO012A1_10029 [Penicillium roqueforti]
MPILLQIQLEYVASTVAQRLDSLEIDYAIMGGASVCLMAPDPQRATEDIDMVIQVDHRSITADLLTGILLKSFPSDFGPVNQFGHTIPGFKLQLPGDAVRLIELEIFDYASWPNRPQYDLQSATRVTQEINGYPVKIFSAEWIIREKILSQYQRRGAKQAVDQQDVENLLSYAIPGKPELDFDRDQELQDALATFLQRKPKLRSDLEEVIKCQAIFGNWCDSSILFSSDK